MRPGARAVGAIVLAGMWVGMSEFFRNQVLLASIWSNHYESLGLTFPASPANAAVWMLWSFLFAAMLWAISRRFSLMETFLLGWVVGFLLMWLVIWNLSVLPLATLPFALPLSLLEVLVAAWIVVKVNPPHRT